MNMSNAITSPQKSEKKFVFPLAAKSRLDTRSLRAILTSNKCNSSITNDIFLVNRPKIEKKKM
jgi:hypothetical protein